MGFLVSVLGGGNRGTSSPAMERRGALEQMLGGVGGVGGLSVSEEGSLRLASVYACVRVLSETVAQLPLMVFERLERGKRRAGEHPLYRLLHDAPNPLMTAFEWRESLMGHLVLWGNGYCEIETDNAGRPLALWPLRPDMMVDIRRSGGGLTYVYQLPDGRLQPLAGERVFHVRGLSPDGIRGYSPIADFARQLVGMGLAVEAFGAGFFRNGARPGGALIHPGKLSDTAYENLRASWGARHEGLSNAHRMAILEEGMSYQAIGVPPDEAQFLESAKLNRSQIASIFRVPPHMIGDLERATFSNIEQQSIEFKTYTMEPWLVRWQQAVNARLLTEGERERYFAEFLADALLRGDTASRYQAHSIGRQNGWLSANDIREIENMNPIEGGDVYLVPLNMVPAGEVVGDEGGGGDEVVEVVEEDERGGLGDAEKRVVMRNGAEVRAAQWSAAGARHKLQRAFMPIYADVARRIVTREANDIGNAAKRLLGKGRREEFEEWLAGFWREHEGYVARQFRPVVESYALQVGELTARELGKEEAPTAETFVDAYVKAAAERHVGRSRARLERAMSRAEGRSVDELATASAIAGEVDEGAVDEQLLEEVLAVLAGWKEREPEHVAREESVRANNALAIALYLAMQVFRKTWVTFGDNCPYCDSLGGRTIDMGAFFLALGQSFLPEGAAVPLVVGNDIGHAPAHDGCDCMVVAG